MYVVYIHTCRQILINIKTNMLVNKRNSHGKNEEKKKKWVDFVARSCGVLSYEWPVRAAAFTEDSAFISGKVSGPGKKADAGPRGRGPRRAPVFAAQSKSRVFMLLQENPGPCLCTGI